MSGEILVVVCDSSSGMTASKAGVGDTVSDNVSRASPWFAMEMHVRNQSSASDSGSLSIK